MSRNATPSHDIPPGYLQLINDSAREGHFAIPFSEVLPAGFKPNGKLPMEGVVVLHPRNNGYYNVSIDFGDKVNTRYNDYLPTLRRVYSDVLNKSRKELSDLRTAPSWDMSQRMEWESRLNSLIIAGMVKEDSNGKPFHWEFKNPQGYLDVALNKHRPGMNFGCLDNTISFAILKKSLEGDLGLKEIDPRAPESQRPLKGQHPEYIMCARKGKSEILHAYAMSAPTGKIADSTNRYDCKSVNQSHVPYANFNNFLASKSEHQFNIKKLTKNEDPLVQSYSIGGEPFNRDQVVVKDTTPHTVKAAEVHHSAHLLRDFKKPTNVNLSYTPASHVPQVASSPVTHAQRMAKSHKPQRI